MVDILQYHSCKYIDSMYIYIYILKHNIEIKHRHMHTYM